jgi:hypothetical protein
MYTKWGEISGEIHKMCSGIHVYAVKEYNELISTIKNNTTSKFCIFAILKTV